MKNYVFKIDIVQGDGETAVKVGEGPANAIASSIDDAIEQIRTATVKQLPMDIKDITLVFNLMAITIPLAGFPGAANSQIYVPQH